jgi:ADP-ribosylglycohydrolase
MTLLDKTTAALYGQAIGDAMGAPVEGWSAERIAARFDSVATFLPPTHSGDPATGKGNGHITDDTLMSEALMRAYQAAGDHLDAYGFEAHMLPEMIQRQVWVPERQAEMPILDRLWWPEKYPWMRLTICHVEPRAAGQGNMVNCGVAMYMLPIGAVNAGDPHGAYQEAASFALAHNESFAVEAGAVMAAAVARAMTPGATIADVCATAADIARDGTRKAIVAVLAAVDPSDDLHTFIAKTRAAVAPFDQRTGHVSDDAPLLVETEASDLGRPSRLMSIEELPIALGALKYGGGDFGKTLKAGVFYGRDCDSIASMAAMLHGALFGISALPTHLCTAVDTANRRDFAAQAREFSGVVTVILAKDEARIASRLAAARA